MIIINFDFLLVNNNKSNYVMLHLAIFLKKLIHWKQVVEVLLFWLLYVTADSTLHIKQSRRQDSYTCRYNLLSMHFAQK